MCPCWIKVFKKSNPKLSNGSVYVLYIFGFKLTLKGAILSCNISVGITLSWWHVLGHTVYHIARYLPVLFSAVPWATMTSNDHLWLQYKNITWIMSKQNIVRKHTVSNSHVSDTCCNKSIAPQKWKFCHPLLVLPSCCSKLIWFAFFCGT